MYLPNMMIVVGLLVLYGCLETRAYLGQDAMLNRPYTREDMIRGLQGITVVDVGDPSQTILYDGNQFFGCPKDSTNGAWSCKRLIPSPDGTIHRFKSNMGLNEEIQSAASVNPAGDATDQQTAQRIGLSQKDVDDDTPVRAMFNPASIYNDESMSMHQSLVYPGIISQSIQQGPNVQSQSFEGNPSLLLNPNIPNADAGPYGQQQPSIIQQSTLQRSDIPFLYYGSAGPSNTNGDEQLPSPSQTNSDALADEEVFARIGGVYNTYNHGYNVGNRYDPVYMQQFTNSGGQPGGGQPGGGQSGTGYGNGGGGGGGNQQTQVYNKSDKKRSSRVHDEVAARFGGFPSRMVNVGNTDTSDVEVTNIIANSFNKDSEKKTNVIDSFRG